MRVQSILAHLTVSGLDLEAVVVPLDELAGAARVELGVDSEMGRHRVGALGTAVLNLQSHTGDETPHMSLQCITKSGPAKSQSAFFARWSTTFRLQMRKNNGVFWTNKTHHGIFSITAV